MQDEKKTREQLITELAALRVHAEALEDLTSQQRQMLGALERMADDQRHAAETIQQNEIQIARAMVEAPFPIMIHAEDGEVMALNKAWTEKTGYRREEIPSIDAWISLAYAADAQARIRQHTVSIYGVRERVDEGEFTLYIASGEERIWSFSSAPLGRTPDGRRTVISMAMDVTERRRAEEALRIKDFAIASSISGIAIAELDGRLIYVNDALLQMWGYETDEELLGRQIPGLTHDRRKWHEMLTSMKEHQSWVGDMQMLHRDGTTFIVHLSASIVLDEDGKPVCTMASAVDVTEQKEAEAALRTYAADLEARTEELDAFAHTVAHDLGNPLARVVGYAELLEETHGELPPREVSRHLHTIAQAGRHAGRIIQDLLLLASVRQIDEVAVKPLLMDHIVSNVLDRLELLVAEQQPEIVMPAVWPLAMGYAPWIEEVLENYVSNALKYGGTPPRVTLGWDWVDGQSGETYAGDMHGAPASFIRFWVQDNGPGIAEEYHAKLFSPFTRLPHATGSGHGLGLSICKRIIEKLGGQVGVCSQPDQGACFSFTLPACPAPPDDARDLPDTVRTPRPMQSRP